jgi:hypothetical protein
MEIRGFALMKNIYNHLDMEEILNRIDKLSPNSQPQWGKMDVAQMLAGVQTFLRGFTTLSNFDSLYF